MIMIVMMMMMMMMMMMIIIIIIVRAIPATPCNEVRNQKHDNDENNSPRHADSNVCWEGNKTTIVIYVDQVLG